MKASEIKFQEIIEGTKQYIVPLFQRTYSWTRSEWEKLWEDLVELCESDNPRPHFMGSLVTMDTNSGPQGVSKFLLIDGQQRLTTILILLSVLRDQAKEDKQEELDTEINDQFLVNRFKKGGEYYKLQPTQVDQKPFYQIIDQKSDPSRENSGILGCYNFFFRKVRNSDLDLSTIKEVICHSFSLVSIILSHDDNPYLVFESLNAKGKPLTQADLIRNYFFMCIDIDQQDSVYYEYWKPMETLLGDKLTEFIRHYLTKEGLEVRENEVYFEIKDKINRKPPLEYLKDLCKFSRYYANLLDPKKEENKNICKYLERLNRLEIATIYPFILNCYEAWESSKITEQSFIEILKIVENFLIRRFVCKIETRGLNKIFALLYLQVSKTANLESETFLERLKLNLQGRNYPKDQEFKERLMYVKLYGGNRTKKAKLILESIEESFQHKEKVSFDGLSIEHIMPQKLNEWWKNHLGEDWAVTHELFLNSLGNLTLTAYNSELNNKDFLSKKSELSKSHLELNKYFTDQEKWQQEDIEKRSEELADIALRVWPYFGDESALPVQSNTFTGKTPKSLKFMGEEYPVKKWREVLEITLNQIIDLEPDKFKDIIDQFPRFVGKDQSKFRRPQQLKNNAFCEANLSAKDIHTFCLRAIETVELSPEDWQVETKE